MGRLLRSRPADSRADTAGRRRARQRWPPGIPRAVARHFAVVATWSRGPRIVRSHIGVEDDRVALEFARVDRERFECEQSRERFGFLTRQSHCATILRAART